MIPHSAPEENPEAFVGIKIIPPTTRDMFLQRKGTVICQVTVKKPSVDKIFWENEKGKEMAVSSKIPPNGSKKTFNVSLDITFDEWSNGLTRTCVVEHTNWPEPIKETYERIPGKKTIHQVWTKTLCLILLVIPSNTL